MITIDNKVNCTGCSACRNVCHKDAISMIRDDEGFLYPHVERTKCVDCGLCTKICPIINKIGKKEAELEICHAGFNTNREDRSASSSGGIFVLLASYVLSNGGKVFGAAFDNDFQVKHIKIDDEKDLYKIMGSKYSQSSIGETYRDARFELENRNVVLFAGSSCQIAGLKAYLRKEYQNLFCVDLICLGIPSLLIWVKYFLTYFPIEKIKKINFKDKTHGWHSFSLCIEQNHKKYLQKGFENIYFRGYFKGLYVRPSCSRCVYKEKNRISDITLADCWGVDKIAPEMDDNKGLSSIVIHSTNGKLLFDGIKSKIISKEIGIAAVIAGNPNYIESQPESVGRQQFWEDYRIMSFKKVMDKHCKRHISEVCYAVLRSIYHRVKILAKRG